MASKRHIRHKSCTNKKKRSLDGARIAASKAKKRTGDNIRVYKCSFCGAYHIGHSKKIYT
jgi:hypothetical protein